MKALVGAFNQEKALVGAFSVITNLRMELFQALLQTLASKFIFSDISADILCDIDFESLSNYDRLNLGRQQSQIPELVLTILKNSFFTLLRATHNSFNGGKTTYSSMLLILIVE